MASSEHLAIVNRGRDVWNLWREQNPTLSPDLGNANLAGMDLSGFDFYKADLKNANLKGAKLRGTSFFCANLRKCCLLKADLRGANMHGAKLDGATLHQSQIDEQTRINPKWRTVWTVINRPDALPDLAGLDLSNANLFGIDLSFRDLSGTNLSGANLSRTNLEGARFESSDLSDADLSCASIARSRFTNSKLVRVSLKDVANWKKVADFDSALIPEIRDAPIGFFSLATSRGAIDSAEIEAPV